MSREAKVKYLSALKEQLLRKSRSDLLHFTLATMPTFRPAQFHRQYYSVLTDFANGYIQKLMVFMPPQHGKALPINTPVLTTQGWKSHGDLQPGDYVFGDDGKTMNGANSLDNLLNNGAQQADIVVVDVIGTDDARYLSSTLRQSFERNDNLSKVMLLKGGRIVEFNRRSALSKRFESSFKKTWNKNK